LHISINYGCSVVTDGITLQQAKYIFNYHPNIYFIVWNRLIPQAPLEVSFYHLIRLYPDVAYQLVQLNTVRMNTDGKFVSADARIRAASIENGSPVAGIHNPRDTAALSRVNLDPAIRTTHVVDYNSVYGIITQLDRFFESFCKGGRELGLRRWGRHRSVVLLFEGSRS
jgi:exopolysaccharide biosynthesis predicted pyruvyltransferase EpsI